MRLSQRPLPHSIWQPGAGSARLLSEDAVETVGAGAAEAAAAASEGDGLTSSGWIVAEWIP